MKSARINYNHHLHLHDAMLLGGCYCVNTVCCLRGGSK